MVKSNFRCEMFAALEKEKRIADIRFLSENQICPLDEAHYQSDEIPEGFRAKKLRGNYLGFTINRYTNSDGMTVYSGYSFANYIEADGTPLVVFSVAAFPTASTTIPHLSSSASFIFGIGCVAAVFLTARSVVKRESKKQWTPFYTSLSDLMNYIYRVEVEANKSACSVGLGRRLKGEAQEMFSWI